MATRATGTTPSALTGAGVVLVLFLALLALAPAGASAVVPDALWNGCETGSGAGQCLIPRGIATDPTTGNVYVADQLNQRIDEFTIWGTFVKSWGWGVRNGDPELQSCTTLTECQGGASGSGKGQLSFPQGIALDGTGDVYVVDWSNHRIQKFDPSAGPNEDEARFLLTFGGEVNKTKSEEPGSSEAERNLCTAASGDICQAGTEGSGSGRFGHWPLGSYVAVASDDSVYVGDENRIQRFDSAGEYIESIPLPGETVQSLAIDTSGGPNDGDLYVARCNLANFCVQTLTVPGSKPDVLRLNSAGAVLGTLAVPDPQGLAVDADGNVYAVDGVKLDDLTQVNIHKFGPTGSELPGFPFFDGFDASIGIAASSACGISGADFYVANAIFANSYVRAYAPPPDPTLCPPPEVSPRIEAQYPTSVQSSGATLKADISPEFWPDTTYYVQYGTGKCSEGACDQEQPLPPGSKLTSQVTDNAVRTAGVFLGGLQPGTTYHYRFVAQSSGGGPVIGVGGEVGIDGAEGSFTTFPVAPEPKADCPNQAFRSEASAALPDCRAYEMVSPLDKNGADVSSGEIAKGFTASTKSSANGDRLAFGAVRSFSDPSAAPLTNQYLSTRGASGWSTAALSPPRSNPPLWPPGFTGQFKAFDEDLCGGWFVQDSALALVPGAPPGVANLYRRDYCDPSGQYELLSTVTPPKTGFGPGESSPEYYIPMPQGFSADQSHTVYRAPASLAPEACQTVGIMQVYLSGPEGPPRLISVLPNGHGTCTDSSAGTLEDTTDGFRENSLFNAISPDASRVFWTDSGSTLVAGQGIIGTGPGRLYLRLNATEEQSPVAGGSCTEPTLACTRLISSSPLTRYWGADSETTKAIYTVETSGKEELFEYDVEAATSKSIAKGVTGVAGIGEDASRIYLVSTEALTGAQQNSEGEEAQAGARNLYLYEAGVGFVFVARVSSIDTFGDIKPTFRSTRLSPDGLHLAFTSQARLADYDNTEVAAGLPAREVYLYDADGSGGPGELRCLSCNPSGARPRGRNLGSSQAPRWTAAKIPGWTEQLSPTRLLSADGDRLFFESYDDLLPRDSNGKKDLYEWQRASGEEACTKAGADLYVPSAGGCLSLISSGQSAEDTELIDASEGGRDVFFTTGSSLLPQDPGLVDVYDARVNGGYPPPAKPPAICEGEACQGAAFAPNDPTPASAAFKGAGNVKDSVSRSRCPKGKRKARKGGKSRCVPRKRHKQADRKRATQKQTPHQQASSERRAG
jgi:DNA-binding beta-propeller fold protein YncE